MYFYGPIARVISTEIMLSLLMFNTIINLYFQFVLKKNSLKTKTKLKRTNIIKFKNKEIKIKQRQINDKNNKKH
jgi:hypothetical protein